MQLMAPERVVTKSSCFLLLFLFVGCSGFANSAIADETARLLKGLTDGNHFALLRHALAPGTGDPAHFDLKNCDSQRKLNDVGRVQARTIGQILRTAGIKQAQVYSSQWCRCMETARLLRVGLVDELEELNSFFAERQKQERQTSALLSWLSEIPLTPAVLLVTHQVNITALTGNFVESGELVIVKRLANKELQVVGTVKTATE